jgi:hypothetical protein
MTLSSAVIIIPVYQEQFTPAEQSSIKNTLNIFGMENCCFVAPRKWNAMLLDSLGNASTCRVVRFDDFFFKNIEGYNRLLLSRVFYSTFDKYEYLLICQPDAWVFANELNKWISKGYDYYGAPVPVSVDDNVQPEFLTFGGNGGFSLRKIKAHMNVLNKFKIIHKPSDVIKYYKQFHKGLSLFLRFPLIIAGFFGFRNNSKYFIAQFVSNEDMFWSKKAMLIDANFKPAPVKEEIDFAFEKFPSQLFEMNAQKLPFGCHAWEKYEPEFWKKFIDVKP